MSQPESIKPSGSPELPFFTLLLDLLKKPDLTEPSIQNLFTLVRKAYKDKVHDNFLSEFGDVVSVVPTEISHNMGNYSWRSHGLKIKVRQHLPIEDGQPKFLSTVFSWDADEKNVMTCSTSTVVPDADFDGGFRRIGDLRVDYLYLKRGKGLFEAGVVDGNDDDLGIPTGEWYIHGDSFDGALGRAYQLFAVLVFGIGEVGAVGRKPINDPSRFLPEAV